MKISIIIVNYNTKELTEQCLQSIYQETQDVDFEIIIVDNASADGSQELLRNKFPNVKLIKNTENVGFGRANNLGAKYAKGKYLFLLNSDTVLLNNAVKILADFMNNHLKCGICGGSLFDADKKPILSYGMLPSIWQELKILLNLPLEQYNKSHKPKKVGYITGADLMIRADLFKKLNGFDSDFFMYYEETELTFRVKKAGYMVYNVPEAEIIHLEGQSVASQQKAGKLTCASRKLYLKKTHSAFYVKILNFIWWLTIKSRLLLFYIFGQKERVKYWITVNNIYFGKNESFLDYNNKY
jgi:GT2 family glycosyltransferase